MGEEVKPTVVNHCPEETQLRVSLGIEEWEEVYIGLLVRSGINASVEKVQDCPGGIVHHLGVGSSLHLKNTSSQRSYF